MLVPVPRRTGTNSFLFYRKGGIAEAVTDEAGKGTLQKAQERQLLRFLSFIETWAELRFLLAPPKDVFTPLDSVEQHSQLPQGLGQALHLDARVADDQKVLVLRAGGGAEL